MFFLVFCLVFSLQSLFLSLLFLFADYQLCCLLNINVWFQKHKLKNTNFWSNGGVATKRFCLLACVLQNVKSYRFVALVLAKIWLMFKNTIQIGISAHFEKQKRTKMTSDYLGQVRVLSGPSLLQHKNGQLAQIKTLQILRTVFVKKC